VKELMTREEFIEYAHEALFGEGFESLCESVAEHNGEVAMFGDAGPGSALQLLKRLAEYRSIARQYERLTGIQAPPPPSLRSPL
jgi:hypothetical protein